MSDPRTLETVIGWLRSGHLTPTEPLDPSPDTLRRAQELATCFAIYPGALQTILEMSIFRPPVDFRLPAAEYRQYAQHRQGQDSLAAGIVNYIAHAQQHERMSHATEDLQQIDLESSRGGRRPRRRSAGADGGDDDNHYSGAGVALK